MPRVTEHGHPATATRIHTRYSSLLLIRHLNTKMAIIGTIIQVSLLIVNAIAILNEERFLAKSGLLCKCKCYLLQLNELFQVGWLSASRPVRDVNAGFQQSYDQTAYGAVPGGDIGVKARLVDLISAVRTLMRSE